MKSFTKPINKPYYVVVKCFFALFKNKTLINSGILVFKMALAAQHPRRKITVNVSSALAGRQQRDPAEENLRRQAAEFVRRKIAERQRSRL
jgi:hypothetical protein